MLQVGNTYQYFYAEDQKGNDVTIEMVIDGIAIATSNVVGDMGPFVMKFDVFSGCGLGDYTGTYLKMPSTSPEMVTAILDHIDGYDSSDKTQMIQDLLHLASTDTLEAIMKKQNI